jgi:hypothetical protein
MSDVGWDHDAAWDRFFTDMNERIEHFGWVVQAVFPTEHDAIKVAWSYTIGLTRHFDHPEIIITGLTPDLAQTLLNDVGGRVSKGECFGPEQLYDGIIAKYAVKFRRVLDVTAGDYFNIGAHYYQGYDFTALQMLWPDTDGRFPDEVRYSSGFQLLVGQGT